MQRELLETLFKSNQIEFSNVELDSVINLNAYNAHDSSQISYEFLNCEKNYVIALYPATHHFNLPKLNKSICRDLHHLTDDEYKMLLAMLSKGEAPKLNTEEGLHIFVDDALNPQDKVQIIYKDNKNAIVVDAEELQKISSDKLIGMSFSQIKEKEFEEDKNKMKFKDRVKALHSLPPMPETASRILQIRAHHEIKVDELVSIIEKDPALVAQIVSYANSAFFGQAGAVKSIKDAIFRVLGVDTVLNMALALSIGSTFKMSQSGPIGAKAIWQSGVFTASLMQRLSILMPWGDRLNPGTAYLVGLLRDFGLLVQAQLFPAEYQELNDYLRANPDEKILDAEEKIFGISHCEVGKMVMRMWNMPEELLVATKYHYITNYHGEFDRYIQLMAIAESMLTPHGLTRGDYLQELPTEFLESLQLDEEDVIFAADEVLQEADIIKTLAHQMCA